MLDLKTNLLEINIKVQLHVLAHKPHVAISACACIMDKTDGLEDVEMIALFSQSPVDKKVFPPYALPQTSTYTYIFGQLWTMSL